MTYRFDRRRSAAALAALLAVDCLAGCHAPPPPPLPPLPPLSSAVQRAAPRLDSSVGSTRGLPPPLDSTAAPAQLAPAVRPPGPGAGSYQLDFADTDIREVVAQIFGMLGASYTIDPSVHGTVTLRTAQPLARSQLLPALETMLAQNGAALVQSGGVYRVAAATAGGPGSGATSVVLLHYASAEDLAKLLQPYAQNGAKIVANTGSNAVIISGDPTQREALVNLITTFDVDALAGQSYALLPVDTGDAADFATALQGALKSKENAALSSVVRVIPMSRMSAVLVVAPSPRYIIDAQRVYDLVAHHRRQTLRSWQVHYLQNGRANDVAYVLQQAFTPNNVTAQPTPTGTGAGGQASGTSTSNGINGVAGLGGASGGSSLNSGSTGGLGSSGTTGGLGQSGTTAGAQRPAQPAAGAAANPLLGGLGGGGGGATGEESDTMRIIPDPQNNSLLIYGTPQEIATVQSMLHKVDIMPLQVRIDAVIAEVDLNDALQYGTQFYFNQGINAALSFGAAANTFSTLSPGFNIGGRSGKGFALEALQSVTKVNVLSSPQLLVLDNQAARLQVGNLVPYQTGSAQSTLTSTASIVSTIDYRETGVIMEVTPRVNSNGLVTLDIAQEVSGVDNSAPTTSGINSPTFTERAVQSRVVVQDGQTVGLAGLISDSDSRGNQGIPWLKDIPILGILAGQQNNSRTRTELLVLLTPHVVHDARDARALTEDLREGLPNSARVQSTLQFEPASGSADPNARIRQRLNLGP
jgi:general secretion pathway protein D